MKTYRIAIIGLGGMGHHHAEAVRAESNCELVGAADIDPGQARKWRERFAVAAVFAEYEEMMDELEPDIVIVATHSPEHCPATLAAARRGIHVFCEKPIALNLVEADAMVAVLPCKRGALRHQPHQARQSLQSPRAGKDRKR